MQGRRARNKEAKRARIVAAARKLFAEKGFEQTRMKALADEADVAVGTLYLYARDKVALAEMISHDDLALAVAEAFDSLPRASVRAQFEHIFRIFYDVHRADLAVARIVVKQLALAEDQDGAARAARFMALLEAMASLVRAAQDSGQLRSDVDPIGLAEAAFGLHYFILVTWLADGGLAGEPHERLSAHLALLFKGLEVIE